MDIVISYENENFCFRLVENNKEVEKIEVGDLAEAEEVVLELLDRLVTDDFLDIDDLIEQMDGYK